MYILFNGCDDRVGRALIWLGQQLRRVPVHDQARCSARPCVLPYQGGGNLAHLTYIGAHRCRMLVTNICILSGTAARRTAGAWKYTVALAGYSSDSSQAATLDLGGFETASEARVRGIPGFMPCHWNNNM